MSARVDGDVDDGLVLEALVEETGELADEPYRPSWPCGATRGGQGWRAESRWWTGSRGLREC